MTLDAINAEARGGQDVLLHDRRRGAFAVGRWSEQHHAWIDGGDELLPISPTHWAALGPGYIGKARRRGMRASGVLACVLVALGAGAAGGLRWNNLRVMLLEHGRYRPASLAEAVGPTPPTNPGVAPTFLAPGLAAILPLVEDDPSGSDAERPGLERERRRALLAEKDAAFLRQELERVRARLAQRDTQPRASSAEGRSRSEELAKDLADERHTSETLMKQMAQANAAHATTVQAWIAARDAADRERRRAEALERQLASATAAPAAAEAALAEAKAQAQAQAERADAAAVELAQARDRVASLENDLTAAQAAASAAAER
ncbi:hypothetical protein SLNSH_17645, partial [Alsobacter soli]